VIDSDGKQQLIYKSAISTIIPAHPIQLNPES
jgi:sRNA-binding regulator protein Hfq